MLLTASPLPIAGYCDSPRVSSRILSSVPAAADLRLYREWTPFARAVARFGCVLVALEWLAGRPELGWLDALRRLGPSQPLVLVTTKDAENLWHARYLVAEEIVWLTDLESALWPSVTRAFASGFFGSVSRDLLHEESLAFPLRRMLSALSIADPPWRSVKQATAEMSYDRRSVWYHWQRTEAFAAGLRFKDFVDWVLLLRACQIRLTGSSWREVARAIRVHEETLTKLARRLTDRNLTELCSPGWDHVTDQFRSRMLGHLVAQSDDLGGFWTNGR